MAKKTIYSSRNFKGIENYTFIEIIFTLSTIAIEFYL